MKTRVIVSVIGIPLLLAVIFLAPLWGMGIVTALIASVSAYEFMRASAPALPLRMKIYPMLSAAAIPLGISLDLGSVATLAAAFLLFLALFCEIMLSFRDEKPLDFAVAAMGLTCGVIMPLLLSSLVRLGGDGRGSVYMLLPLVAAFITDTGAYFIGSAMGRHKLAPRLSQHKTIEGSAGGFIFAVLGMLAYGLILRACGYAVNLPVMASYGLLGSLACQLGDLSFSAVKRQTGIKDYGNLIPGHGGMLDRFDSMCLTAPMLELLVLWVPAITK